MQKKTYSNDVTPAGLANGMTATSHQTIPIAALYCR